MMYEVITTKQADVDLRGIYEYIAFELLSLENAAGQLDSIVKSLYINQLLWIMIGMLFVGIITALSYLLHGVPFEQVEGISGLLVLGISISLSMGAKFIPNIYLAGEDKTIVFLIISLLCAVGIAAILFNIPLFGQFILIGCSILLFILSFSLTVCIFKKAEKMEETLNIPW